MPSTFDPAKLDNTNLEKLRFVTDPLADDTVSSILTAGKDEHVNQIFIKLVRNKDYQKGDFKDLGPDLSQILDRYFETSAKLPEWSDNSRIRKAEHLFSRYGPEIFLLLNVSSLPMCYTCAKGARVLYDTGRLMVNNDKIDPLARRLMETAQMIVNVMSPGGLGPKGKGIITIQKVRLIHACIRYFLLNGAFKGITWNEKELGKPINQEDLAGTLMSFSPVILTGLKQLGIGLSPDEADAYSHFWKVVGHLMGIHPELLPDTYDEGMELAAKILNHQAAISEQGKALTDSCIQFINYIIPGNVFEMVPAYLIDFFLRDFSKSSGKNLSECIGIEIKPTHKDKMVMTIARFVTGHLSHLEEHQFIGKIAESFNQLLLRGIIHHFNAGKDVHFFLPPSLQKDWGIEDEWVDELSGPSFFDRRLTLQKKKEIISKSTN